MRHLLIGLGLLFWASLLLGCTVDNELEGETAVSPALIVFYTDN